MMNKKTILKVLTASLIAITSMIFENIRKTTFSLFHTVYQFLPKKLFATLLLITVLLLLVITIFLIWSYLNDIPFFKKRKYKFDNETKAAKHTKTGEYICYQCLINDNKEFFLQKHSQFMICIKCHFEYRVPSQPILKYYTHK